MTAVINDDMQLFKQFTDNEGFRRWLTDNVFGLTYFAAPGQEPNGGPGLTAPPGPAPLAGFEVTTEARESTP